MTTYIILEKKGHLANGIVPHDVIIDGGIKKCDIDYSSARDYVKGLVKPEDTVIEQYMSTGTSVKAVGKLPE